MDTISSVKNNEQQKNDKD